MTAYVKPAVCLLATDMGDKDETGDAADTSNMGYMSVDQSLTLVIPPNNFSISGGKNLKLLMKLLLLRPI